MQGYCRKTKKNNKFQTFYITDCTWIFPHVSITAKFCRVYLIWGSLDHLLALETYFKMCKILEIRSCIQDQTTLHLFLINRKRVHQNFLARTISKCVVAGTSKWIAKVDSAGAGGFGLGRRQVGGLPVLQVFCLVDVF